MMIQINKTYFILTLLHIAVLLTACTQEPSQTWGEYRNFLYEQLPYSGRIQITGFTGNNTDIRIPSHIRNWPVIDIRNDRLIHDPETGKMFRTDGVFEGKNLINVVLPNRLRTIGSRAFANNNLVNIGFPDTLVWIFPRAFMNNRLTNIVIPNNVRHIGGLAFESNQLTEVTIGSSVQRIELGAFRNNKITSLTVPASIIGIHDSAFASNKIEKLNFAERLTEEWLSIAGVAFENNKLTALTIPSNTGIGPAAFRNNNITQIVIGDNVHLHQGAFKGNNITKIVAGENVQLHPTENIPVFGLGFDESFRKQDGQSGEYVYKEGYGWSFTPNN